MNNTGSGNSSGMGISMRLESRQTLRQTLDLDDGDKDKMGRALEFWENKTHTEMKFPMKVMFDALGIKPSDAQSLPAGVNDQGKQWRESEFVAEFVTLSPKELAELDSEEKCGVLLGDCIFVSEAVPEQYIPMIIANLGFLRQLDSKPDLAKFFEDSHVDIDMSRHWTANMLDILLAGRHFADQPKEREKYLVWRKQVERTDFFKNEVVSEFLRRKTQYLTYKRTTHPLQRAIMAKKSWLFSGMLYNLGSRMMDENARMLGVAKTDIIIRIVCDKYDESFDPEMMCEMINYAKAHSKKRKGGYKTVYFVDFNETGDKAGRYSSQAELLTAGVVGDVALMDSTNESGVYNLRPFYRMSTDAFVDRIAFFTRAGLIRSGIDRQMLGFLKQAGALLQSAGGAAKVKLQLGGGDEAQKIAARKGQLLKKLEEIEAAHDKFIQLRIRFTDMQAVDYMPGKLEQNYLKILAMREKLEQELADLNTAESSLDEVMAILEEQKELLASLAG